MFDRETYIQRRNQLKELVEEGLIVFLGNNESPMNYPENCYHFRQDSSFIYYFGLDAPSLAATIDIDANEETLFGDELTVDDIVWMGALPSLRSRSAQVGIQKNAPLQDLQNTIKRAHERGQQIHFLPQYRGDNIIKLADLLEVKTGELNSRVSEDLAKAVIAQRSIKSDAEIVEIEKALEITYDMHFYAMSHCRPKMIEQHIAGAIEGIALSRGGYLAFPAIVTKNGQTLHNHYHGNKLEDGDLLLNDSGASAPSHYAGDITRTTPVSGSFSEVQGFLYELVLTAQEAAIAAIKPGVKFLDTHLIAATSIATGLTDLGVMKGDVMQAVRSGAHALFMPHGLGHMLGLDVHDLEGLGEDWVGYDHETHRSTQFGLSALRMGKRVEPGHVLTVEPGIYFIPQLIEKWRAENKFTEFIDYAAVQKVMGHVGGIRTEDNIVVTPDGCRILGKRIPKTLKEVEQIASR